MVKRGSLGRKGISPSQWVKIRKISQVIFFIIFLALFFWSRREFYLNPSVESGFKETLVNLPLKLDPLVMIAQAIASRKILRGSLLAVFTLILTFFLGRVWCGWFCPMGTILEWLPLRSWKKKQPSVPEWFRGIKYVLLMVILFSAIFTNLTLLFLDPLTIGYRTLTTAIWPGLDKIVTFLELQLIHVPFLSAAVGGFDSLIRPAIFPAHPAFFRYGLLYIGFFFSLIVLNVLAPRFWCRYLCPLGGLLGLLGKVSLVGCEITSNCSTCGKCVPVCPTGAIKDQGQVFCDPGECTMCLVCAENCPGDSVKFPFKVSKFLHQPYDIERRKVLLSMGATAVGVGLLETNFAGQVQPPNPIRPPGVVNERLLSTCIRCGECSTVCPTNAIQMAVLDGGVEGFWTPVIVPRIGYCDYSCQACGQVCPVEAIPPLSLEKKRRQVIGKALIDRDRCLPWAENQECIVCEEMCPVPDKAIELELVEVSDGEGGIKILQRPIVVRKLCIGCGICENKCPVSGEAAIQITVHSGGKQNSHNHQGWN